MILCIFTLSRIIFLFKPQIKLPIKRNSKPQDVSHQRPVRDGLCRQAKRSHHPRRQYRLYDPTVCTLSCQTTQASGTLNVQLYVKVTYVIYPPSIEGHGSKTTAARLLHYSLSPVHARIRCVIKRVFCRFFLS